MNGNPSKKQQEFHNYQRACGCIVCGDYNPAIHHIIGSKMKLKGCVKPGEWFVLPLCYAHHQGPDGVHAKKKNYDQKLLWKLAVRRYQNQFYSLPMSEEEYQIILERG